MSPPDVDAIIFDNDGVLVDSEIIHVEVERELLGEIGLNYSYEDYMSRFVGLSPKDFEAELSDDHEYVFGRPFPDSFRDDLKKRVWPRIEAELKALPGAANLVARAGRPTAVASSATADRLQRKLEITGLRELFDPHIYSSQMVPNGKPAPDLFLHAASKVGIAPDRCMVIEDSMNGVRAGRAANMFTVGFTGGSHADAGLAERLLKAGAHLVVASHDELFAA